MSLCTLNSPSYQIESLPTKQERKNVKKTNKIPSKTFSARQPAFLPKFAVSNALRKPSSHQRTRPSVFARQRQSHVAGEFDQVRVGLLRNSSTSPVRV